MKSVWLRSAAFFILCALLLGEPAAPAAQDKGFAEGAVQEITRGKIVIRQRDYETNSSFLKNYGLTPRTAFTGCRNWSELRKGDQVKIDYGTVAGKRLAVRIERSGLYAEVKRGRSP